MVLCCADVCDFIVFFFKQKTAYEMRISDWSSDVCSSDLFLRQSSYGLSGGVGGDFRPVGRREALGGGFCAIQRLGGAPAGRQRQIGVKELAGEQSKRYHVT